MCGYMYTFVRMLTSSYVHLHIYIHILIFTHEYCSLPTVLLLSSTHAGLIHRDIKPENIMFHDATSSDGIQGLSAHTMGDHTGSPGE